MLFLMWMLVVAVLFMLARNVKLHSTMRQHSNTIQNQFIIGNWILTFVVFCLQLISVLLELQCGKTDQNY